MKVIVTSEESFMILFHDKASFTIYTSLHNKGTLAKNGTLGIIFF